MTIEYQEYRCKSILIKHKMVDEDWFWVKYSAHPYVGCAFGCHFCYFRAEKYLNYVPCDQFHKVIRIKINAPQMLKKQLSRVEKNVIIAGDWQPAEKKYGLSRKMLEVIRDLNFPLHILERSPLLTRDLDILEEIDQTTWCCVSYSFSTVDEGIVRIFEHRAPTAKKRMESMKKISDKGILTGLSYMPILPYITDDREHIEDTISTAKEHGAQYILAASMTMEGQQRDWVMKFVEEHYPELVTKYQDLYKDNAYSTPPSYNKTLYAKIAELAEKHDILTRIPRPKFETQRKRQTKLDSF